ncbi:hypothetical protein C2G38_2143008 [Gigaspora rosea]|uniref:Uncharacterized protein n=1 Tax=Gigaspora rosea TaxID=44941 RepID=A0A397V283_9GLOM|nr:hypothetical protein C2G38_2143008 [Gigaspora rosea]
MIFIKFSFSQTVPTTTVIAQASKPSATSAPPATSAILTTPATPSVTPPVTTTTTMMTTTKTISVVPSETTKPITSKTSVNNPPNEITIFTQAVTEVYPGYETTITTSSDGVLMTYVTYYPPRTAVVLKPVTSSVPAGDSIVGTGTNLKYSNGLINVIFSLWLVLWSLVYMILL